MHWRRPCFIKIKSNVISKFTLYIIMLLHQHTKKRKQKNSIVSIPLLPNFKPNNDLAYWVLLEAFIFEITTF